MAAKEKQKKKNNNKGYGKVILILGIMLALAVGANFVVPDMVKDVKAGDGPFTTIGSKISSFFENMKKSDEEETKAQVEGEEEEKDYSDSDLIGSWTYDLDGKKIIFTFRPDGSGSMTTEGYEADMKYSIDGDIVTMKYYLDGNLDETEKNQFEVDGDVLYLTQNSGEGTKNELTRYSGSASKTLEDEENMYPAGSANSYAGDAYTEGSGDINASYSVDLNGQNVSGADAVLNGPENFAGDQSLVGSWTYSVDGSYAVFTFNYDGTGLMIADGQGADLLWDTEGNVVTITYYVDGVKVETEYDQYQISGNQLSLTSDSGSGRTNTLTRQ